MASKMFVDPLTGNVGIGTTSPLQNLHVQGSVLATTQVLGPAADTVAAPGFSWSGNAGTGVYRPTTDTVAMVTASTERLRVDSTGNVGIGTANPLTTLDIVGSMQQSERFMVMWKSSGTSTALTSASPFMAFPITGLTLDTTYNSLNGLATASFYDSTSKGFIAPYTGLYSFTCGIRFTAAQTNIYSGLIPYNCFGVSGIPTSRTNAIVSTTSAGEMASFSATILLSAGNILIPYCYSGASLTTNTGDSRLIVALIQRFR